MTQTLRMPAVVPMRDPFMVFLTWWKHQPDVVSENRLLSKFYDHWNILEEILHKRQELEAETVIFHVDKETPEDLAELVDAEYVSAVIRESAHYVNDQFVQPRWAAFPDKMYDLAEKWGYSSGDS